MSLGPSGVLSTWIPSGASASATAFATAAWLPMAPPSPMPLKPPGLVVDGVSRCPISTVGTSVAVGSR